MDFKERLKKEQEELKDKVIKLEAFLNSEGIQKLSNNQETMLRHQLLIMYPYIDILQMRMVDLDIDFKPY